MARKTWFADYESLSSTVLGVSLGPLTLSQFLSLHKLNVCFVSGDIPADDLSHSSDLANAVLCCALGPRKFDKWMRSPWAALRFKIWGWKCQGLSMADESAAFQSYIEKNLGIEGLKIPEKSEQLQAPLAIRLYAFALERMSIQDALNSLVFDLVNLFLATKEEQGQVKFWNEDEDQLLNLFGKDRNDGA